MTGGVVGSSVVTGTEVVGARSPPGLGPNTKNNKDKLKYTLNRKICHN